MEAREQNVEVSLEPVITIKGKPLADCSEAEIAREILALCKDLQSMRKQVMQLREFIGDETVKEVENAAAEREGT